MVKKKAKKSKVSSERNIVILGAGYAGVSVVQTLAKRFEELDGYKIILIDKYDSHVFQGELYEVATAFQDKIRHKSLPALKSTVATPIKDLIDSSKVKFVKSEVKEINPNMRQVILKSKNKIDYDYLVLGMGSSMNYYGIPGLQEHSTALKTVEDAIEINRKLDQFVYHLWDKQKIEDIDIIVGGGGAAGVELAGELKGYMDKLCKKYSYPHEKVKIALVEGSSVLAGMRPKGTRMILERLRKLGVEVHMDSMVEKLKKGCVELRLPKDKKKVLPHDVFIWTGGVMVNPVVSQAFGKRTTRGGVEINPFLQSIDHREVFAAGDNAYLKDPAGNQVPMLAQVAWVQGVVLANNLVSLINGRAMQPYVVPKFHWLVPVGGKFALWQTAGSIRSGFWVWLLKRFIYLRYYLKVLPFSKAVKKFFHSTKLFIEND